MKNRVLHVMQGDKKFNLPLVNYIITDLKLENHKFIIFDYDDYDNLFNNKNVVLLTKPLRNPFSRNFVINFIKVFKEVHRAEKIIAHGAQLIFYLFVFSRKFKKIIWIIHGGIDLPTENKPKQVRGLIKKMIEDFFKRNVAYHATHIEEDSFYANKILSSNAKYIYTPAYLSNVINRLKDEKDFLYNKGFIGRTVLVGNSTDPHNNHFEAFSALASSSLNPSSIYSILSYGINEAYKENVINRGFEIFGLNFKPITQFLEINQYLDLLDKIDFVIFNHERQEAMGATIQLLSLGKPIFFNPKSPAYCSFLRRGYKVFSISELRNYKDVTNLNLSVNRKLLKREYNIDCVKSFYMNL